MKVLIIDSSLAIINRLRELLSEEKTVTAIFDATTYDEAIESTMEKNPDILILDSNIHDKKSIEWIKEILTNKYKPEIIALINNNDEQSIELLKINGVEYIYDKYHEFQKIPETIRMIASKRTG